MHNESNRYVQNAFKLVYSIAYVAVKTPETNFYENGKGPSAYVWTQYKPKTV